MSLTALRALVSTFAPIRSFNMSPLRSIVYLSSTNATLSDVELEALLLDARSFNESVNVTGVLLYNGSAFLQYFEGESDACAEVFRRIRASSRHHSIHTLVDAEIPARYFSSWAMAFSKASGSQTLAISQAQWLASPAHQVRLAQGEASGIAMLVAFWRAACDAPS